ncbi:MAG: nucleoside monophosphate kinase [bacterium]|nr:nucleoside monophosphate kinase [bacterium]
MILFMGVAGSGKSMQGKLLADKLALPWLSTGEFLRMMIAGQRRKDMLAGKLLNDQEIIGLVQKIFNVVGADGEFILDGFPRTSAQADWLLAQVKHGQLKISAVVHLQASKDVVLKRLIGRGRQDDNESSIKERFEEYEASIKPILGQFMISNIPILEINAELDPKTIHQEIITKLEAATGVHES